MVRIVKNPDERRRELITCAQTLFFAKGYERTSVNDIVSAVGVAKGTFYYYFNSKSDMLEALVTETVSQQVAMLEEIVDDDSLPAIPKWVRAFHLLGSWKTERRAEMIAMLRMLRQPENIRLQYEMRTQAIRMSAPVIAKIIAQGVSEGVFETPFAADSAEIALAIMETSSNFFAEILLNPAGFDQPGAMAQQKVNAAQAAVERVIGAPPGSLPIIEPETLSAWFTGDEAENKVEMPT